jgi:hypothetical protein
MGVINGYQMVGSAPYMDKRLCDHLNKSSSSFQYYFRTGILCSIWRVPSIILVFYVSNLVFGIFLVLYISSRQMYENGYSNVV